MRTILITLLPAGFFLFAAVAGSTDADASNNSRLNQCAWYKSQANAAGRAGNEARKEKYWQMYRDCMRGRID
ncbi:MAG: hypothetical protein ACR2OR_15810 [Hyphomicrobiales bacterium]